MRLVALCLLLAACASGQPGATLAPTPSYAPVETVTVRASAGEAARRLVSIYAADAITVASNTGGTITTAPVRTFELSNGSGATRATGTVDYFYRATIAGDSVTTVALAMWWRLVTRSGSDPESPAREEPIKTGCPTDPRCAPYLERMRRHAESLREHR